jgi:hypothetical protein
MSEEPEEEQYVYAEGNTVFFFCDVDEITIKRMCILLKKVSKTHDNIKLNIKDVKLLLTRRAQINFNDRAIKQPTGAKH